MTPNGDSGGSMVIAGGQVLVGGTFVHADLTVKDGQILSIDAPHDRHPVEDGHTAIDASGKFVVPGLVDLQVNGGFGIDLAHEPERIDELALALPSVGVTAWLPTLVSSPSDVRGRFLDAVDASVRHRPSEFGAEVLGAHLEGPLLNPDMAGAHDREHIRAIDDGPTGLDRARLVTLAPELVGAASRIESLCVEGVVVSAGHSNATAEEFTAGVDVGVTWATHLFNAMRPIHHRDPGIALAALMDDRVRLGLIVDGHHLADHTVRLVWQVAGPDRVTLVSDATAALGMTSANASETTEDARLGSVKVKVADGVVRTSDGVLAGTALSLPDALRRLRKITGCDHAEAWATATSSPAAVLGLRDRAILSPGNRANLIVADADFGVLTTIIGGRIVFEADGRRGF